MLNSNTIKSCTLILFLVVVLGVFIGLSMCSIMHSPRETFVSQCSSNPVKKCVRVISSDAPLNESPREETSLTSNEPDTPGSIIMVSQNGNENDTATSATSSTCPVKKKTRSTTQGCPKSVYCPPCPKCPKPCPRLCPDMSKYVLKTSVPPCPETQVDMDVYMLKSKCKTPDMSKYVLKSSLPSYKTPPCPPCICKCSPGEAQVSDTESTKTNDTNTNALSNLFDFSNGSDDDDLESTSSLTANDDKDNTGKKPTDGVEDMNNNMDASHEDKNSLSKRTGTSLFDSHNDMFGSSGVLGDANMSAWNDGGSSDFGASISASSNLISSCNASPNMKKDS